MRIVSPYLDTSSTGGGVTLLAFNSHARVLARPGERRPLEELTASVSGMEPEGNTDLNAGLAMACREMQARESGSRQALVLITDGVHNGARLHEPHRCFAKHGWPVFSYGVGRANAPFLERLAAATGGEFRPVAAVFDPVCEMERLRTLLSGGARGLCSRYLLRPGENLSVPLTVPPEQSQLALAVTWTVLGKMDGEQSIKTTVRLPGGSMLNAEAALSHEEDTGSERYAVASPAPGIWEAVLSGHGLPSAGALLSVSFGTTPVTRPAAPAATETPAPEEQGGEASPEETPDDTITPTPGATEEPETSPTPAPTRRPRRTPAPTATASPQTPTPSPLPSP
jgi:hypothetical protein